MILANLILPLVSSNLLLSDHDPLPWERLGSSPESALEDSVKIAPRRVVATSRDAKGTLLSRDTTDHWIDSRGRCLSRRTWTFADSTRNGSLREWGIRPDRPSDSAWLETWTESVPTRRDHLAKSSVPGLHRAESFVESPWASPLPDSIVLQLDDSGRLRSRQDRFRYWTRSLWAELDASGAPSRWGNDALSEWSSTETHHPRWEGTRLLQDSIVQVVPGPADAPDTTIRRIRCTWKDSLLITCRTPVSQILPDTSSRDIIPIPLSVQPHFLTDSVTVLRTPSGSPLELRSTLGSVARQTWDDLGRLRTRTTRSGSWFRLDSLDYLGESRTPWQRRTGLIPSLDLTMSNGSTWDTITEYAYTTAALAGISAHGPSTALLRTAGDHLLLPSEFLGHRTLVEYLDPHGRVQGSVLTQDARAPIPKSGAAFLLVRVQAPGLLPRIGKLAHP